jgi:PHP family Zn ribbon phosphoesterase
MIKADLHLHSVLSPCGDIEMTPSFIIRRAKEKNLGMIAVTDHNSARGYEEIARIGRREGVAVMCGAEITTREEVHVVAIVDDVVKEEFQLWLDRYLPKIPNREDIFGYQIVVNESEDVVYQEPYLLLSALDRSIDQAEEYIHSLGGIFIPAHIDKLQNSITSQLGFVPPGIRADALELSYRSDLQLLLKKYPWIENYSFVRSSDAHYPDDFGNIFSVLDIQEPSFEALKEALKLKKVIL